MFHYVNRDVDAMHHQSNVLVFDNLGMRLSNQLYFSQFKELLTHQQCQLFPMAAISGN